MKHFFSLLLTLLVVQLSFAQTNKPQEIQQIIDDNQERFVFELTHDRVAGDDAPNVAPLSRGFNVYFTKNIPLGESSFSVAPGIGIANRQVYLKDAAYVFSPDTGTVTLDPIPSALKKNSAKIAWTYVDAPVELRWNSPADRRGNKFKVATGFRAGYAIGTKFKYNGQVYTGEEFSNESGSDSIYSEKFKIKKLEDLVKYRVAPSFRVGYGSVNVFGLYQLNKDFESDKGPEMNGYTIGVSISSF